MARGHRGARGTAGGAGFGPGNSIVVSEDKTPMFLRDVLPGRSQTELVEGAEGHWARRDNPLRFDTTINAAYGDTTGVVSRAICQTPVFDLRYDLGFVDGNRGNNQPIRRETMLGINYDLFVTLNGFATILVGGLGITPIRVTKIEFGHASDPLRTNFFQEPEDISIDFYSGNSVSGYSELRVVPSGPLRYWGCAFVFDTFAGSATTVGTLYAMALH